MANIAPARRTTNPARRRIVGVLVSTLLLLGGWLPVMGVARADQHPNPIQLWEWDGDRTAGTDPDQPGDDFSGHVTVAVDESDPEESFTGGAKENDWELWQCSDNSAPSKSDITDGEILVREVDGEQFLFMNFTRLSGNGSAHLNFELIQSATAHPQASCSGDLSAREDGNLVITVDATKGGKDIQIDLFEWDQTGHEFTQLTGGNWTRGIDFEGAESADGLFVEAGLNLTTALGGRVLGCNEFGSATMKSRASASISAELKDYTLPVGVAFGDCPESQVAKAVRNVTDGGEFATTAVADPGDTLEYRLTYDNLGDGFASSIAVSDVLAAGQTPDTATCTVTCTFDAATRTLTFSLGTVDAGGQELVTFQVTLAEPPFFAHGITDLTNTFVVDTFEEDPITSNQTTVGVEATAVVVADKLVRNVTAGEATFTNGSGATAVPGEQLEYQISVTNTGNATATGVVISDDVPEHASYKSCSDSCSLTGSAPTVVWSIGDLEPAATATVTMVVDLDPTFPVGTTPVDNTAVVVTDQEDPDSPEVTTTVSAAPDVSVAKAVRNVSDNGDFGTETGADPAETVEYQISVRNDGDADASSVVVTDTLDPRHTLVAGSCTDPCSAGTPTASGTPVSIDFGVVSPGDAGVETYTLQLVLDATFASVDPVIANTATVSSTDEPDEDSNTTTITLAADADSDAAKSVRNISADPAAEFGMTTSARPGDVLEYRFSYANNGAAPAYAVTITDELAAGQTLVSATCTSPGCSASGQTVTLSLGDVAAGGSASATFQVTIDTDHFADGSHQVLNAGVYSSTNELDEGTNETITTVNADADSAIAKAVRRCESATVCTDAFVTALDPSQVDTGDHLQYRISYRNNGDAPATGVVLSDPVPSHTTVIDCGGCVNAAADPLVWNLGTVDPMAATDPALTRLFTVQLADVFPNGTTEVDNTAVVVTDQDTKPSNKVTVTIAAAPVSELVKLVRTCATDAAGAPVCSGDFAAVVDADAGTFVEFELTFTNTGDAAATDVTVTDAAPTKTTAVSCAGCNETDLSGDLSWDLGTVTANGGSKSVTFVVELDGVFEAGTTDVDNIASVTTAEELDENEQRVVTDSGPARVVVSAEVVSELEKLVRACATDATGAPDCSVPFAATTTAQAGGFGEFQLTYVNNGNAPATGVTITDAAPLMTTAVSCAGCEEAGGDLSGTLTWKLGDIAAYGGTKTVTFIVELDGRFTSGDTDVDNIATVATDQEDTDTDSNEATITVSAAPVSELQKLVRPCVEAADTDVVTCPDTGDADGDGIDDSFQTTIGAQAGTFAEFLLVYVNTGNAPATAVTVSDAAPVKTTAVSCAGCNETDLSGTITWSLGTIEAYGDSKAVSFVVELDGVFLAGTTAVDNTATVSTDEESADTDSNEATITVSAAVESALDKAVRACGTDENGSPVCGDPTDDIDDTWVDDLTGVDAGGFVEYRLVYLNKGNAPASEVTIVDVAPVKTTAVSCDGCDQADGDLSGDLTWDLGTIDAYGGTDSVTFVVELDGRFVAGTTNVDNTGIVTTHEELDPTESDKVWVHVDAEVVSGLAKHVRACTDDENDKVICTDLGDGNADGLDDSWSTSINVLPGADVQYLLTYTNVGNAPATDVVITDAAPAKTTAVSCDGCNETDVTGDLTWDLGDDVSVAGSTVREVAAYGGSDSGTFIVRVDDSLTAGEHTIDNVATVETAEHAEGLDDAETFTSNPVYVHLDAVPALAITKSGPESGRVDEDGDFTYTITFVNNGAGTATGVVVSDTLPAEAQEATCTFESDDVATDDTTCADGTVRWNVGDLALGESGSITVGVTARLNHSPQSEDPLSCQLANTATITRDPIADFEETDPVELDSDEVTTTIDPVTHPEWAIANGWADGVSLGIHGNEPLEMLDPDVVLPQPPATLEADEEPHSVESSVDGTDSDEDSAHLVSAQDLFDVLSDATSALPLPSTSELLNGDVLVASALDTSTQSGVQPTGAESHGVSEVLGLNLLNGTVTADLVRSVADAAATGSHAEVSSVGSTAENLRIDPDGSGPEPAIAVDDAVPNTIVPLDSELFGDGSYVVVNERIVDPFVAPERAIGEFYKATIRVTGVRVVITDLADLGRVEVAIAPTSAHAEFPQTAVCDGGPDSASLTGWATVLRIGAGASGLGEVQGLEGFVQANAGGRFGHAEIDAAGIDEVTADAAGETGPVLTATTTRARTEGALDDPITPDDEGTTVDSIAEVENACVLPGAEGDCLVGAELIRATSTSTAKAEEAGSSAGATQLRGLTIGGVPVEPDLDGDGRPLFEPAPNTKRELPGIGWLVLNEQCADLASASECSSFDGNSGPMLRVRAIRIVVAVDDNPLGLSVGTEIIVAEAMSAVAPVDLPEAPSSSVVVLGGQQLEAYDPESGTGVI